MLKNKDFSISLIEDFITKGKYKEMKQLDKKSKLLTSCIKERLESSEIKRHVFQDSNLVGRFTAKKIYSIDYIGLNEYLYNIGLLTQVAEIDNKTIKKNELYFDMIQDFKLDDTFFIKTNFNKVGKDYIKFVSDAQFDSLSISELAKDLSIIKPKIRELNKDYELLKGRLLTLPEIEILKQTSSNRKPISHKYGSISVVANQPKYDIASIYNYLGEGILIDYGRPSSRLLENFVINGLITEEDINQFKKITDIRLDFSIMTLDDENKILNLINEKKMITAAQRIGA